MCSFFVVFELVFYYFFFFFKQKTAYEMRISDWSSDVCSSDLRRPPPRSIRDSDSRRWSRSASPRCCSASISWSVITTCWASATCSAAARPAARLQPDMVKAQVASGLKIGFGDRDCLWRSEEHTSELQSLMRISYAVFCLKKKKRNK